MAAVVQRPSFDSSASRAEHGSETTASPTNDSKLVAGTVGRLAGADSEALQDTGLKSEFGADKAAAAAAPAKTPAKLCCVCQADSAKYKCARCAQPFCSVACNRTHQDNHPEIIEPKPPVSPPRIDTTSLQQASEPLDPYKVLLDHTSDFKNLFARYPTLEKRLGSIYEQTLRPTDDGQSGYRNGLPWKLGKGGQPPHKDEPWTLEKGLRKGAAALRLARMDPSEVGDGVREYCELVLYVLGKQDNRDVTNIVRSEIVQEETRVIERLLREDEP